MKLKSPTSIRKHLWWVIPNELAGMPLPWLCDERLRKPDAAVEKFDDDVRFLGEIGIRSIVAALELPRQKAIFKNCGFHYLSLQIPDGCPPTLEQAEQVINFHQSSPLPLAVHCEGGIGRTGTLLAVLLLQRGLTASAAIKAVKTVMPPALEIPSQREFIFRCEKHLKIPKQKE